MGDGWTCHLWNTYDIIVTFHLAAKEAGKKVSTTTPNLRAGSKCIIYQPWSMGWRCKVRSQCSSSSPHPTFLIYKCARSCLSLRWRWQRIIHHSSRLLMKISSLNSPCFAKKLWRREGFCIDVVLVAHVTTTIICYYTSSRRSRTHKWKKTEERQ